MKKNFYGRMLGCFLAGAMLMSCEKEEEMMHPDLGGTAAQEALGDNCYSINFEQFTAENPESLPFISAVTGAYGSVGVYNTIRTSGGVWKTDNVARIYDTANPTGDDAHDLGQPKQLGKMLIANQYTAAEIAANPDGTDGINGRIAGPNDNAWGAKMNLDFSKIDGAVTLNSITVVDIDTDDNENQSFVELTTADGGKHRFALQMYSTEGYPQVVDLKGTQNVVNLEVVFDGEGMVGSGAIDNIVFCVEKTTTPPPPAETGCTRTQGYWKTHADANNQKKYDSTWDAYASKPFFKSGDTYLSIMNVKPRGNSYYILAHQYVAVTLNRAAGASLDGEALSAYNEATKLFNQYSPADVAKNKKQLHEKFTALSTVLDKYNNGIIGPGHCDE